MVIVGYMILPMLQSTLVLGLSFISDCLKVKFLLVVIDYDRSTIGKLVLIIVAHTFVSSFTIVSFIVIIFSHIVTTYNLFAILFNTVGHFVIVISTKLVAQLVSSGTTDSTVSMVIC
jgi:hypothetical protein